MDSRVDFDIHESLKQYLSDPASIATPEADPSLVDCENDPDNLTSALVNAVLDPIIDAVAENPDAITQGASFDSLQFLLKCAPVIPFSVQSYISDPNCELFARSRSTSILPPQALSKVLDLVVSGLSSEAEIIYNDIESDETDTVQNHKRVLEIYGFLLQWTLAAVETKAAEKSASASASVMRGRGGKGSRAKPSSKHGWDSSVQVQTALDVMAKTLKLRLSKIFATTSERDTFVGLFTRSVYLVLESEARVKITAIRMHCFKVLCIAVKHHVQGTGRSDHRLRYTANEIAQECKHLSYKV